MTTIETITKAQIEALRTEAAGHGDEKTVEDCETVLRRMGACRSSDPEAACKSKEGNEAPRRSLLRIVSVINDAEAQRQLGLSRYETAFQILHKLRAGMVRPNVDRIGGDDAIVEMDETLIGGETRGDASAIIDWLGKESVDDASAIIDWLGKESVFPCSRKSGPRGRSAEGKHDNIACINVGKIEWGRALTPQEYDRMCSACRAYYHAQAMRNDLIEFMRTR